MAPKAIRLVSFLGTGNYSPVIYRLGSRSSVLTPWVTQALCELIEPQPVGVVVLATQAAWDKNGTQLTEAMSKAGMPAPQRVDVREGGDPEALWQQFAAITEALRAPAGHEVVLDITLGFRSQPFFSAAVGAFVRAVDDWPNRLRVVYGAIEAKQDNVAPVWELTTFVDLLDWTREIIAFLHTGRVAGVASRTRELGRALAREWSQRAWDERGTRPSLDQLAEALEAFGNDLATVRTGALTLGNGSAARLSREIERAGDALAVAAPPLADVLDKIAVMARPLRVDGETLASQEGQRAVAALARLYLKMGRYSEAASTIREGWVTLYAEEASAACPGPSYSRWARERAEGHWSTVEGKRARNVANIRNDIDHAGFGNQPLKPHKLIAKIHILAEEFAVASRQRAACGEVFVNISNHPFELWEQAQRQAAEALAKPVVDIPFPDVPPTAGGTVVDDLCNQCLSRVPAEATHAMVQGEFTLTFRLVRALQKRRVVCLAATTEREVGDDGEGGRVSRFRFVGFRQYSTK